MKLINEMKIRRKLETLNYEEVRELAFLKLKERELNRLRQQRKIERDKLKKKGKLKNHETNEYI